MRERIRPGVNTAGTVTDPARQLFGQPLRVSAEVLRRSPGSIHREELQADPTVQEFVHEVTQDSPWPRPKSERNSVMPDVVPLLQGAGCSTMILAQLRHTSGGIEEMEETR